MGKHERTVDTIRNLISVSQMKLSLVNMQQGGSVFYVMNEK